MKAHPKIIAGLIITIGILSISTAALFIRFAQNENVPSILIAATRMLMAAVIMAPILLSKKNREFTSLSRREWIMILSSGFILAIHMGSWVASLQMTSVVTSVVVVTTAPIWVGLLSFFILKEKVRLPLLVGMSVAIIGGILIGINQYLMNQAIGNEIYSRVSSWGIILALIGAICSAGYLVIGRVARKTISLPTYAFLVYGVSGLFLLIGTVFVDFQGLNIQGTAILWLILLAIIPQVIGHSSFNWALKHYSPVLISIALLGEPVGAGLLALVFLGESPTWLEGIGAGLILIGIFIAILSEKPFNAQFN